MTCFASSNTATVAIGRNTPDAAVRDTPPTTVTQMRYTSSSLNFTAESTQSEEITPSRGIADIVRTASSSSGEIGYELYYGQQMKEMIQAVLMTTDNLSTGASNGNTKYYHSIVEKIEAAAGPEFAQFDNQEFNTMSMTIEQGSIVAGSFGVLGSEVTFSSTTAPITTVSNPDTQAQVFNAVSMVIDVEEGGASVGEIQGINFTISNNKAEQRAIGDQFPVCTRDGDFVVEGTLTAYFASNTLYQKFVQDQESSISIILNDASDETLATGNTIRIDLPRVNYQDATREIPGRNEDILVEMGFTALPNASDIVITVTTTDAP